MKELLGFSVLYITLAFCQAYCFHALPKRIIRNEKIWYILTPASISCHFHLQEKQLAAGELVTEKYCIDPFDGNRHPPGSDWNTEECLRCSCHAGEMRCCARYGGVVMAPPGCISAVDPETCQHELYNVDNPSEPCF